MCLCTPDTPFCNYPVKTVHGASTSSRDHGVTLTTHKAGSQLQKVYFAEVKVTGCLLCDHNFPPLGIKQLLMPSAVTCCQPVLSLSFWSYEGSGP